MKKVTFSITTAIATSLLASLSFAQSSDNSRQGPPGGGRKPPQEAYTACEGQTENAIVSFTGRRGEALEATCVLMDGELVAKPTNPPERGQR